MGRTILITGAAGHETNRFAECVAARQRGKIICVETAEALNDMGLQQAFCPTHPLTWRRVIAYRDLLGVLLAELDAATVVIDGLSQWVATRLLDLGDPEDEDWGREVNELETSLHEEARRIVGLARAFNWTLILISTDPSADHAAAPPLGRAFRGLVESLNQTVADLADGAYAIVAGLPVELKRPQEVVI